jgi:hypothetical protein
LRRFLFLLLAGFTLPFATKAESMKDQYQRSYGDSQIYSSREEIASKCTVEKANFVGEIVESSPPYQYDKINYSRDYYCVFEDGTIARTSKWIKGYKEVKYGPTFVGILDKSIRHNPRSQVEYSIEGENLVSYACYKITYAYDPNGKCETDNIYRTVRARWKY